MTRYVFQKPCRALALLEELQAAGLHPDYADPRPDGTTAVELPPGEYDAAAAVVAAHNAAAIDAAEVQKANLLKDAKATLRTYYQQSPATITNAQSVAAIKALIVAVRALAQLDN